MLGSHTEEVWGWEGLDKAPFLSPAKRLQKSVFVYYI